MFLEIINRAKETNKIKVEIYNAANALRENIHFYYYRIKKGISKIFSFAREGLCGYFKVEREKYKQLTFKLE